MRKRLGSAKWADLIAEFKRKADRDDNEQVFVEEFAAILKKFKIKVSQSQLD